MGQREPGLSDLKGLQHCCVCDMHAFYIKTDLCSLSVGRLCVHLYEGVQSLWVERLILPRKERLPCQLVKCCCSAAPGTLRACLKCPAELAAELAWQGRPWGKRFGAGFHLDLISITWWKKTVEENSWENDEESCLHALHTPTALRKIQNKNQTCWRSCCNKWMKDRVTVQFLIQNDSAKLFFNENPNKTA